MFTNKLELFTLCTNLYCKYVLMIIEINKQVTNFSVRTMCMVIHCIAVNNLSSVSRLSLTRLLTICAQGEFLLQVTFVETLDNFKADKLVNNKHE